MKRTLLFFLTMIATLQVNSQTLYYTCQEALNENNILCDLDDLDSYQGINPDPNDPQVVIPADPGLCFNGGVFNNPGWVAFVAGQTFLEITIIPYPGSCSTVPSGGGTTTGLQVAVWSGCPDDGGNCVAGDVDCPGNEDPITLTSNSFIPGETYVITVDGCAGSACAYEIRIVQSQPYDIPDPDPDEIEVYYSDSGCDSSLDDGTFCVGQDVTFTALQYDGLIIDYTWSFDPPVPIYGSEVQLTETENTIEVNFNVGGEYTVCLEEVYNGCETTNNPACIMVNLVSIEPEDFGLHHVCFNEFPWLPPANLDPNDDGVRWNFNNEILDEGYHEFTTADDCGCEFTQSIEVVSVGTPVTEEITLNLCSSDIPYDFLGEILEGDEVNAFFEIDGGSMVENGEGDNCDSLVSITVNVLEFTGQLSEGPCTPNGTEYTYTIDDSLGIYTVSQYQWTSLATGMVVDMNQTAQIAEEGEYTVSVEISFSDGLGGTSTCSYTDGPFTLESGSSPSPQFASIDTSICSNALTNIQVVIDTVSGSIYSWTVPMGVDSTVSEIGDTITLDLTNYATGEICAIATNACGESLPTCFNITFVDPLTPVITALDEVCIDGVLEVTYGGDTTEVVSYTWNSPDVMMGDTASAGPLTLSFGSTGFQYFDLTVVDTSGCVSVTTVDSVFVDDYLPSPAVSCTSDPDQITFSWNGITGATGFDVVIIRSPAGATGSFVDDTTYVVTGLTTLDTVDIVVTTLSNGICGNTTGATVECVAGACSPANLVLNSFRDTSLCINDPALAPFNFDISAPPNGVGNYSGPGITNGITGEFNPTLANIGVNTIDYNYTASDGCPTTVSVDVTIYDEPRTSFSISQSSICLGESVNIDYTGQMTPSWDFGADAQGDENNLIYTSSGLKTVTVSVLTADGCTKDSMATIEVRDTLDFPEVTCGQVGIDFVTFDWDDVTGSADYIVEINGSPVGSQTNSDYTQMGLMPGDIVTISVTAIADNDCPSVTRTTVCEAIQCNAPAVNLDVVQTSFCIDDMNTPVIISNDLDPAAGTSDYSGIGITDAVMGVFDPDVAGVGTHTVYFSWQNTDGCLFTNLDSVTFTIYDTPVSTFALSDETICMGESINILYSGQMTPTWNFGTDAVGDASDLTYDSPGIKTITVSVLTPEGCTKDSSATLEVLDTLNFPGISCGQVSIDFVSFDWDDVAGASEYLININGVPMTNQTNSDWTETGLMPGDQVEITVTAVAINGCPSVTRSFTCEAIECNPPQVTLDVAQTSFCLNEVITPVDINTSLDASMGTSEFTGPGITNMSAGIFDPAVAGVGTHTIYYNFQNNDGCLFSALDSVVFTVYNPAVSAFMTSEDSICLGENVTVMFNGDPNAINDLVWNFNNATNTQVSPAEHQLTWDLPGEKTISLTINQQGCSTDSTLMVVVNDTLLPPVIQCIGQGTDFVTFDWNDVTGAEGYFVTIDGNPVGPQGTSEFTVEDLNPDQMITITITALDSRCGDKTSTATCTANACTPADIDFSQDGNVFCYNIDDGPLTIDVSASSNMGMMGTGAWTSTGIGTDGTFQPDAGDNDYTLTYSYIENNCVTEDSVTFRVVQEPDAMLRLDGPDVICITDMTTVTSDFVALNGEVETWDFGDLTNVNPSGLGLGPYDLTFNAPGTYDIDLTIDNEGCTSETEMVTIVVEPELEEPAITCDPDIFSASFSWDPIDCADSYIISVDGNVVSTQTGTNFTVMDLVENQGIEFVVEAVSGCACGNKISIVSCTTMSCPSASFTFQGAQSEVCQDETASPFQINTTISGPAGNGNGTWQGSGISSSGLYDPSSVVPGTYTLTYNYEEIGCVYDTTLELTVLGAPDVSVVSQTDPECADDSFGTIVLDATGGAPDYMYSINNGPFLPDTEYQVNPGLVTIEVMDANGCIETELTTINPAPAPTLNVVGPDRVIVDNTGSYSFDLSENLLINDIIWTVNGVVVCQGTNCSTYEQTITEDITICVEVTYNNGCKISNCLTTRAREIQAFYIPNAFSPDGDGVNDQWSIFIKGSEVIINGLNIYDRWGELVHTLPAQIVANELVLWDGSFNNRMVQPGVYVYLLELNVEGIDRKLAGDITVIR